MFEAMVKMDNRLDQGVNNIANSLVIHLVLSGLEGITPPLIKILTPCSKVGLDLYLTTEKNDSNLIYLLH